MNRQCLTRTLTALLFFCIANGAYAAPPEEPANGGASPPAISNTSSPTRWTFSAKGGVSFFAGSRSKTLAHLFKPNVRLAAQAHVSERTTLGLEAVGVVSESKGYRLLGAYIAGHTACYRGDVFRLNLLYGMGAGSAPKILSPQLDTDAAVAVWAHWGIGFQWKIPGEVFALGLEVVHEQITVVTTTFVLSITP